MDRLIRWSDAWVSSLARPEPGEDEVQYPDPAIPRHRLVVSRFKKVFEVQMQRPAQYGPKKTYKVQTGIHPDDTVEEARARANVVITRIRKGEDPRARSPEREVTVGGAWEQFQKRPDIRPSTLKVYKQAYEKVLEPWGANKTLRHLVAHPAEARDEHARITKDGRPSKADHAFRLLRAIYLHAAELDTSLPRDRHPCTAVDWNGDNKREGAAIPAQQMPAWFRQLEALREESPVRAGFHALCLRLGLRPGELAKAEWSHVDWKRKAMAIPESKTVGFEVPLSRQAVAELKRLQEEARALNKDGNDFVFPSRGDDGRLKRLTEDKDVLSHTGNCGRHAFATIAGVLGYDQRLIDVLQGRTLVKSGVAGTGYLDRTEFGPKARKAAQAINDEIDRLATATSGRRKAR